MVFKIQILMCLTNDFNGIECALQATVTFLSLYWSQVDERKEINIIGLIDKNATHHI